MKKRRASLVSWRIFFNTDNGSSVGSVVWVLMAVGPLMTGTDLVEVTIPTQFLGVRHWFFWASVVWICGKVLGRGSRVLTQVCSI